jgi:hypothetical protein
VVAKQRVVVAGLITLVAGSRAHHWRGDGSG